nr:RteC domain-containing protein [Pedobacter panaciterrae]
MLENFVENLYCDLYKQLESINGSLKDPIKNLTASLLCISSVLNELKRYISVHGFETEQDEIRFFKYVKPRFYCWHIYVIELNNLVAATPIGTEQMLKDYYLDELKVINRCFSLYQFNYQYYLLDETAKDQDFFLRRNKTAFPLGQELVTQDPDFSTNQDYIFSKFRAYEMLRNFVVRRLNLLYYNPENHFLTKLLSVKKKFWSGDKVELIELAYGIYHTRRLNNGKAEISDIIEWLEDSLHIDLSQAYRMFLDIRRRKTISYTKYLDEMIIAINQHIDETNRYKSRNSKKT